jgi:hypothetical protein
LCWIDKTESHAGDTLRWLGHGLPELLRMIRLACRNGSPGEILPGELVFYCPWATPLSTLQQDNLEAAWTEELAANEWIALGCNSFLANLWVAVLRDPAQFIL